MQPGTVIRWDNLTAPHFGGKLKPRWLVCLGCTDFFSDPLLYYFHSTTTKDRAGEPRLELPRTRYPYFGEDCFIYFNEKPYCCEKTNLNSADIVKKGKLDPEVLRRLYEGIRSSRHYSKMQLIDIHSSLNMAGLTGIKKP
jgi:hypothetical protein